MGLLKAYRDVDSLLLQLSAEIKLLNKKDMIFQNIPDNDKMGIVLEGIIYLCAENESLERSILQFFRPGDVILSSMLIPLGYEKSYLISKTSSRIAILSRNELISFCMKNPTVYNKLEEQLLASPEAVLVSHNYILQQKTIRRKLKEFFTRECMIQRTSRIELPIPFSDLAEYLAVDRTSMMKELGKMKEDGLITGKNHKLTINFYQYLR